MPGWRLLSVRSRLQAVLALALAAGAAGCGGGGGSLLPGSPPPPVVEVPAATPQVVESLAGTTLATKNTTRFGGASPAVDAADVALAEFPSAAPGTHPTTAVLVPADDWQAALAASVLSAAPLHAPILISGRDSLPPVTRATLRILAPGGAGAAGGAQVIRIGDVPDAPGMRTASVKGSGPYALAAAIDRFSAAAHGSESANVVIASGDDPAYAMPAAGWAAESGEPILYVNSGGIPGPTRQALLAHPHPRMYVLGPASVIPDTVLSQLRRYGTVKRIEAGDPVASAVAFSEYRDPPCAYGQPCAHFPGSFGWAMRSPGHGYVLLNLHRPLDAAAAAPLSASGDFGPQLLLSDPSTLPSAVLNYFLDFATPGYTSEGPTAAVYNHGWIIGDTSAISVAVQAQVDQLLEPVAQR